MKDIYLVNYSVNGIKTIDETVSLSFYKKTFQKNIDTQQYNVKGIYGMNGSGKTGIVASIDILKNLLSNAEYLSNPIVQRHLDATINKHTEKLSIEADFLLNIKAPLTLFRYSISLSKNSNGKYTISHEQLSTKKAFSKADDFETVFTVDDGILTFISKRSSSTFTHLLIEKTLNLLSSCSMTSLFIEKIFNTIDTFEKKYDNSLFWGLCSLFMLGRKIHVYLDQSDDHKDYLLRNSFENSNIAENHKFDELMDKILDMDVENLDTIEIYNNYVYKNDFDLFCETVNNLSEFLRIFKSDLQSIEIEKKDNKEFYVCNLIMVYETYKIHAEFESTGIKKLIKLYAYLNEMVQGGIVFIDEFDSNLHDVYLCALLEYLMEYGEGQLCFTTHNVGPMDILKKNKKSIDFLSVDHKIYPWTSNGNYSPSKLYRNGMIEGSPFNVDSIDFIKAFHIDEEADA